MKNTARAPLRSSCADEPIEANRGTIYDANMNVLAKSATVWNVVASPKDMNTDGTDIYMVAKKTGRDTGAGAGAGCGKAVQI